MNLILRKSNSLYRYILWHYFSKKLDLIHVAEYPKSGGTWLTQLISEYCGLENRRNKLPKFEKSVMHGHYMYNKSFNNPVCILRDGRDIVVSYYHHMIIGHVRSNKDVINKNRKKLNFDDYNDVKANLPKFIEYLNIDYKNKINGFSWAEFVNSYLDRPNVCFIKYEDMLLDAEKELVKVLNFINHDTIDLEKVTTIVEKFSFKKQANRNPGEENKKSFLRKGISGDWKNYFTEESAKVFDHYCGEEIIKLGYEKDRSWISQLKS